MADGDRVFEHRHILHYILIDAKSATSDGAWIDTADFSDGNVHVNMAGVATVQIYGSSRATVPASGTNDQQIGPNITSSMLYPIVGAPRWMKAVVSAWTSAAVSVFLVLRRPTAS